MPSPSLSELERVLSVIEQVQQQLSELFEIKGRLLHEFQGDELRQLASQEEQLVARLQQVMGERRQMLDRARRGGLPVQTMTELAARLGAGSDLRARLDEAQLRAIHLQHEGWMHWIISHRCYTHYTELLELIAHGGQSAPAYNRHPSRSHSGGGGTLLDTSI